MFENRNIFIGQNENYLFCGVVYRYRNLTDLKIWFSDKDFPCLKQLGFGWPRHVYVSYTDTYDSNSMVFKLFCTFVF